MKNVWRFFSGALVVFVLAAGGIASADSLSVNTKEADTGLTVFFGPRTEFDQSGGSEVPVSYTNEISFGKGELSGGDFGDDTPEFSVNSNELVGEEMNFSPEFFDNSVDPGTPGEQPGSGAVPEPGTLILLGIGVLGLLGLSRRKKH